MSVSDSTRFILVPHGLIAGKDKMVSLPVRVQRAHGCSGDACGDIHPFDAMVDENFVPLAGDGAADDDENVCDIRADEDLGKLSFEFPGLFAEILSFVFLITECFLSEFLGGADLLAGLVGSLFLLEEFDFGFNKEAETDFSGISESFLW